MDALRVAIKEVGLVPDHRVNHWERGVPQNPATLAYKVYHYHLNNPPCTMSELCKGIGMSTTFSHKVHWVVKKLRKARTWKWLNRGDREQAAKDQMQKTASQWGEEVW